METKANYVVVGAFTLFLLLGLVTAVVWLADVELDEEFSYYDLLFEGSVTGLKPGNPVRYRGVPVGVVTDMKINPDNVEQVKVTIEVPNETPIKEDSEASLEFQGITGIAFVQITGGTHAAPKLRRIPGQGNPVIKSKPSQLQEIIEAAPELVNRVISLVDRANLLLGDANQKNFAEAMANVNSITGSFAAGSDDISTLLSDGASAVTELQKASTEAQLLVKDLRKTVGELSEMAKGTLGDTRGLLGDVRDNINLITEDARGTIGEINTLSKQLSKEFGGMGPLTKETMAAVKEAADDLSQSQEELTELLAENRGPINNFTSTGLYEITQLVAEARTLMTALSRISGQLERDPARFLFGDSQRGVGVR